MRPPPPPKPIAGMENIGRPAARAHDLLFAPGAFTHVIGEVEKGRKIPVTFGGVTIGYVTKMTIEAELGERLSVKFTLGEPEDR